MHMHCSRREPEINSHHPHWVAHNHLHLAHNWLRGNFLSVWLPQPQTMAYTYSRIDTELNDNKQICKKVILQGTEDRQMFPSLEIYEAEN